MVYIYIDQEPLNSPESSSGFPRLGCPRRDSWLGCVADFFLQLSMYMKQEQLVLNKCPSPPTHLHSYNPFRIVELGLHLVWLYVLGGNGDSNLWPSGREFDALTTRLLRHPWNCNKKSSIWAAILNFTTSQGPPFVSNNVKYWYIQVILSWCCWGIVMLWIYK